MQRWERCSVFSGEVIFYKISGTAALIIKRGKAKGDRDDNDAYNRVIAELGLERWEFAGMNGLAS